MIVQPSLFDDETLSDSLDTAVTIDGLFYLPELLDRHCQASIVNQVDSLPWMSDLKRRVQHYGYRYDYRSRRADPTMYLGALPDFAIPVVDRLLEAGLMPHRADQLIVNEYESGQGISAHVDCEPCFGETIAMVSLGWAYEMDFIHEGMRESRSILLAAGSAVAISGAARHHWLHQIRARKSDRGIARKRRISLTFRNILLS